MRGLARKPNNAQGIVVRRVTAVYSSVPSKWLYLKTSKFKFQKTSVGEKAYFFEKSLLWFNHDAVSEREMFILALSTYSKQTALLGTAVNSAIVPGFSWPSFW